MSYFKAKMHQILFPLGSTPDPAGGVAALPRPPSCIKGPTSKGREGKGKETKARGEEGKRKGKVRGEGKGREGGEGMKGAVKVFAGPMSNSFLRACY